MIERAEPETLWGHEADELAQALTDCLVQLAPDTPEAKRVRERAYALLERLGYNS